MDSMNKLTEKVIQADLVSRKKRIITKRGLGFAIGYYALPVFAYVFYFMVLPNGKLQEIYNQQSSTWALLNGVASNNFKSLRFYFKPEIYHRDISNKMTGLAEQVNEIVKDKEEIKYKAYIWH